MNKYIYIFITTAVIFFTGVSVVIVNTKENANYGTSLSEIACTASSSAITIGDDLVTTVLHPHSRRCGWQITNLSGDSMFYSIGDDATASSGQIITASSSARFGEGMRNTEEVTAMKYTGTASTTVYVTEFIY